MARQKKYKTEAALLKAINGYFDSISRLSPVNEPDGSDGLPRKVIAAGGEFMQRREYLIPPTISALCLFLGISRQTWSDYAECFPEAVADAKLRIECYLEEQLLTRKKGIQGIMFNLQNNYGWSEKKELELGEATRKDMLAGMSIEDKLNLIKSAGEMTEALHEDE